ncbi:MAG: hypothetical protein D6689_00705, partial [Deltaproteobacteria bacterium]
PASTGAARPSAARAPAPAPPTAAAHKRLGSAPAPRRWTIALQAGAVATRGDLGVGPTVGIAADARVTDRLRATLGVDWAAFARQDDALLSPPGWPRGRGQLIQETAVTTAWLGAAVDVARFGQARPYARASLGIALHRTQLRAFSATATDRTAAPAIAVGMGVRGQRGAMAWGVDVAWRETTADFGMAAAAAGENTASGLSVTAGAGAAF